MNEIDKYIASFPKDIQERLQIMRAIVKEEAAEAEEAFSYQMPTFKLNKKNLVHFAAFNHHIGFYPTPSGIEAFPDEVAAYKNAKGSVQFPHNKPLPEGLIRKMVQFRVKEVSHVMRNI